MAESFPEKNLKTTFDEAETLFCSFYESGTRDAEVVSKTKCLFEEATNMVSQLDMFSSNETVDDIPTGNIRYLLLPAYLGIVTSRHIVNQDRLSCVEAASIYFQDFLKRCKSYEITDIEIPEFKEEKDNVKKKAGPRNPDLEAMTKQRDMKIQKYKEMKERAELLERLKIAISKPNVDDEVKRKYYLKTVDKWIDDIISEVEALNLEKQLLSVTVQQEKLPSSKNAHAASTKRAQNFIITKNEAQKKVFGAGYTNIPTMTIDEFYEREVKEGRLPQNGIPMPANEPESISKEEKKEQEEELDDPIILKKNRAMDDWKDDHQRGWGNRKNRS